jgi:Reverse transcriptase (RNA-dependent DNA polymerase)
MGSRQNFFKHTGRSSNKIYYRCLTTSTKTRWIFGVSTKLISHCFQRKKGPNTLEDFRPINVISFIPKLITKLLADWLSRTLSHLISKNQTAFIHGRKITETFLLARQSLTHLHKNKIPSVLIKIDFKKAFDTISWDYLLNLMRAKRFPDRWISWIYNLLISSSSTIRINGQEGTTFFHRQGLRQGDPLSPMLFILAA